MVYGLLLKLLITHQIKMEKGTISLRDIKMTLLPAFVATLLTDYFYRRKELWKLYFLLWFSGFVTIDEVKKLYSMKKPDQVYSFGMNLGEAMGIGIYKTHDYYPGRYTHFIIPNNPFIEHFPRDIPKKPIDYFITGTMAGGGCIVHSQVCQCVEVKCKWAGNENCEFLTGTEKELKSRGLWEKAEKRYNLEKIYPLQKFIFDNFGKMKLSKLTEKVMKDFNSL